MADKKKKNVFVRIFKYLRECIGELKKITWPTFSQTTKNFGIVLLVIVVVGLFIFALDQGLYALLGLVDVEQVVPEVSNSLPVSSADEVLQNAVQAVTTAVAG